MFFATKCLTLNLVLLFKKYAFSYDAISFLLIGRWVQLVLRDCITVIMAYWARMTQQRHSQENFPGQEMQRHVFS